MKLFLICSVLTVMPAFSAATANNPVDKGSTIISGQMYFQRQSGDLYECTGRTTVQVIPGFGFFVSPGFMIGAEIGLLHQSACGNNYTEYAIGPKIGYYFNSDPTRTDFIKGTAFPHIAALGVIGSIHARGSSNITVTQFGAEAGVVYMMSNAVGVDFAARFSYDTWSVRGWSNSGITIKVGVGVTAFVY